MELPTQIYSMAIDANTIQMQGSLASTEGRCLHAQRLTYQVGEYVVAEVGKVMRSRKYLK